MNAGQYVYNSELLKYIIAISKGQKALLASMDSPFHSPFQHSSPSVSSPAIIGYSY